MRAYEKIVETAIRRAIESKDANLLGKIAWFAEAVTEEGFITDGPFNWPVDRVLSAIGEEAACKEMAVLLAKQGLEDPMIDEAVEFEELTAGYFCTIPNDQDAERFYIAVAEFLFQHADEAELSDRSIEQFTVETLEFLAEPGEEGLEEFVKMLES